jgi:hypothetical protein
MNKKQLNNQYYYWNSQQRPTTLASDIVSEVADPINYIPMGFASKGAMKLKFLGIDWSFMTFFISCTNVINLALASCSSSVPLVLLKKMMSLNKLRLIISLKMI